MILDISRILKSPGDSMDFNGLVSLGDDVFVNEHIVNVSEITVEGKVKNISGVIVLEATGKFSYSVPCDRCGEQTDRSLVFDLTESFVKQADESLQDAVVLEGDTIDLRDITEREAFANLPLKNLCREDCKGLCLKCGANLNNSPCECKDDEWNPQFESLKGLIFD
ncbi:MAG: DUF177 domain-containing protein [Clostridia bacterium]|nr:DUF177 domain-containing protein [Clostridia bacterium]